MNDHKGALHLEIKRWNSCVQLNVVLAARTESNACKKIQQTDLEGCGLRNVTLRPYQLEGLSWLVERYRRGHGCILGDEMGLKTLQL